MRHGIQEAGCQPSQAAVAQSRVLLTGAQCVQINAQILEPLPDGILLLKIDEVVFQQSSNEEFHGEIMDLLLLKADMPL